MIKKELTYLQVIVPSFLLQDKTCSSWPVFLKIISIKQKLLVQPGDSESTPLYSTRSSNYVFQNTQSSIRYSYFPPIHHSPWDNRQYLSVYHQIFYILHLQQRLISLSNYPASNADERPFQSLGADQLNI